MPSRAQNLYKGKNTSLVESETDDDEIIDDTGDLSAIKGGKSKKYGQNGNPTSMLSYITKDAKDRILHNCFPALNITHDPNASINNLRCFPHCKVSAPQSVYVSTQTVQANDICLKRPYNYDRWHKRLMLLKTQHKNDTKKIHMRSIPEQGIYHSAVFDLAEHLASNPDEHFHGTYDYYYTGGNLALLPVEEAISSSPLVAHTSGSNLQHLHISKFCTPPSANLTNIAVSTKDNEIFEIQPLKSYSVNRGHAYAMRQRDTITLAQLRTRAAVQLDSETDMDTDTEIETGLNLHTQTNQVKHDILFKFRADGTPFISFAQAAGDSSKFLISNMKQAVRCFDLGLDMPKMTQMYKLSSADRICSNVLRAWQRDTFIYANDRYLCPMDIRTDPNEWLNKLVQVDSPLYQECDMISMIKLSNNYFHRIYVATSHKLHCMDVRYMSGYLEGKGSIATWTHQLEQIPMYMDTLSYDNMEFIALSSNLVGDMCICEVSADGKMEQTQETCYSSYALPYKPPTLDEALRSARQVGKCLEPYGNINKRIQSCTTGLQFFDMQHANSDDSGTLAYLLSSNSLGDVFAQNVKKRCENEESTEKRTNAITTDYMVTYEERVVQRTENSKQLTYTTMHDLKGIQKIFNNIKLSKDDKKEAATADQPSTTVNTEEHNSTWRQSMQTLAEYKDYLTEDLLSIWDIEYEKTTADGEIVLQNEEPQNSTSYVNNWLEQQPDINSQETTKMEKLSQDINDQDDKLMNEKDSELQLEEDFLFLMASEANEFVPQTPIFTSTQLVMNETIDENYMDTTYTPKKTERTMYTKKPPAKKARMGF